MDPQCSVVADEMDGFIKVVAEEATGRILGGHIICAEASTFIHEIAVAILPDRRPVRLTVRVHPRPIS